MFLSRNQLKRNLFSFLKDINNEGLLNFKPSIQHFPVMKDEVLGIIKEKIKDMPHKYHNLLDTTIGTGGHSLFFLNEIPNLKISGIDSDSRMIERLQNKIKAGEITESISHRLELKTGNFMDIQEILEDFDFPEFSKEGLPQFDIIFSDLGYNSLQLENPDYGLKYSDDGTLDMRYSKDGKVLAKDLLNNLDFIRLDAIFKGFGEEPRSSEIAHAIISHREKNLFETNKDLKTLLDNLTGNSNYQTLKRVFQALRIAVNQELHALEKFTKTVTKILKPNGILIYLTFHSLESTIVLGNRTKEFLTIAKSKPSDEEIRLNPRSKSASLIAFKKKKTQSSKV